MKLEPFTLDHDLFIHSAFRYALGRATYIVGSVAKVLIELIPEMRDSTKQQMMEEIKHAIEVGQAGHSCDVAEWERVYDELEASQ